MDLYACVCKSSEDKHAAAERDIWRLRGNWLFLMFTCILHVINYTCVLPTNHQFIINPTADTLNITDERVKPGLEQNEAFYSLTYVALFAGHTTAAVASGLLFNLVPTWYLFLVSTLCHTLGYLLYALATNGWMMMLARGLAGAQMGSVDSLVFAYYAVSFEKYRENMKTLGKFDEKKTAKVKGYILSSSAFGYILGFQLGVAFPAILAQFPETPQFRPAGWFCVAAGVVLLLLQLVLFHGESAWNCSSSSSQKGYMKELPSVGKELYKEHFCKIFIPLYVVLTGGLKGVRFSLTEVLLNPIVSDSFGFSVKDSAFFFLTIFSTAPIISTALLYLLQYLRLRGYGLTVLGLTSTIISLLIMTDWQAIGSDSCTEHSLFHHPQLADQYRLQLAGFNVSESGLVSAQSLQVVEGEVYQMAVNRCQSAGEHCHWIPNSRVTHKHCSDCQPICRSTLHTLNFAQFIVGVVLFFSTNIIGYNGLFLLLSNSVSKKFQIRTITGFILPTNSIYCFQGISNGSMVALMDIARSVFPFLLDGMYEGQQKKTYLSMLIQVWIFLPLLVGLLLLYPWLAGSHKIQYSQENEDTKEEEDGPIRLETSNSQ